MGYYLPRLRRYPESNFTLIDVVVMELKEYQQNTLKRVKAYLEALKVWRGKNEKMVAAAGREAALDVPLKAW